MLLTVITVVVTVVFLIINLVNTELVQLGRDHRAIYKADAHEGVFPRNAYRSMHTSLLSYQVIPSNIWDLKDNLSQQLYPSSISPSKWAMEA